MFLALWETEGVGIFDPMSPTALTLWTSGAATVVNPYSIDVEEDGEVAWFTAGEDNWIFGNLNLNPGLPDSTPDINMWESTTATTMETECLRWDPDVGTVGRLFISADNTDAGADELGKFDPASPAVLRHYGVCTDEAGLYGIDVEPGEESAWISEWEQPGALAEVDATGDGIAPTIALTQTTVEDPVSTTEPVPHPWVYQIAPKTCPITPNVYTVEDRCDGDLIHPEEFPISPTSQPTSVAVKDIAADFGVIHETWTADTFDDRIVVVLEYYIF